MSEPSPEAAGYFFHDGPLAPGRLALSPDESHHLGRARRVRAGQKVYVIDGQGTRARARVDCLASRQAELEVVAVERVEPALRVHLVLGFAVAKPAHAEQLITQCTELGVAVLVPMLTERTVARPGATSRQKTGRWRRHAIEAAKQSRQAYVPTIEPVRPFAELVGDASLPAVRLLAHPDVSLSLTRFAGDHDRPESVIVCIGPEGGFTDDEVALARGTGFLPVRLGPTILRIETAATAACAQIAGTWG